MRRTAIAFLTIFLLGFFCIGATELAACRVEEPQLYRSLTKPVAETAESILERTERWLKEATSIVTDLTQSTILAAETLTGSLDAAILNASNAVSDAAAALTAPREPQIASEPSVKFPTELADPVITELVIEDGEEYLTGGNVDVPYYGQGDELWADAPYGKDKIGPYGCGPVALAMTVSALTTEKMDPATMANWAVEHGYWASRSGSYLSIVQGAAEGFGLQCTALEIPDANTLYEKLSVSRGLMVALMAPGHFTQNGHFIILRGTTLDGGILIADPNSRDNSLTIWDPQVILDELSASRSDGAPLWLITAP